MYDDPRIEEISFGRYEGLKIGGEDPQTANLSECAADYLLSHGMSEEALSTLMDKLTK